MEREILYRGKRIDNGNWAHGYYAQDASEGDSDSIILVGGEDDGLWCKVDGRTVGQFTGLTDKNYKRICEGDIATFGLNEYQIIYECGSFALFDDEDRMISKIGGLNDNCYSLMNLYLECMWEDNWAYDIEVIGNVHDNPEESGGVS